ncbi:MAG: 2TM domain-containing protein [bacterium]|nr:2TM domain-containing protein [bacterium]
MNDQAKYERARKKVEEIRGFYYHLLVYVLVNVLLFLTNILTSRGDWWFYWPLFGWGIGIAVHAFSIFAGSGLWGRDWEERKIKQLMEKDRQQDDS